MKIDNLPDLTATEQSLTRQIYFPGVGNITWMLTIKFDLQNKS